MRAAGPGDRHRRRSIEHGLPAGDIALPYTRPRRRAASEAGKTGQGAAASDRQPATRLLNICRSKPTKQVFRKTGGGGVRGRPAKFLHTLHIYRIFDLPYQSQIIPLAAILADIGDDWHHNAYRGEADAKNGTGTACFGEL